ncbi:uncharacterized protein LOC134760891 [Pongo abelii]|uniref:uncharacterized protein LOC134760891 n=1 Tax=Pongo abelii TaxID=9601 RepID=UPI0030068F46
MGREMGFNSTNSKNKWGFIAKQQVTVGLGGEELEGPASIAAVAASFSIRLSTARCLRPGPSHRLQFGECFPAKKLMMEGLGEHSTAGEMGPLLGAVAATASPHSLMEYSSDADFIESLPLVFKYRVYTLKKLQAKCAVLEAKYLREFHSIERTMSIMRWPVILMLRCMVQRRIRSMRTWWMIVRRISRMSGRCLGSMKESRDIMWTEKKRILKGSPISGSRLYRMPRMSPG